MHHLIIGALLTAWILVQSRPGLHEAYLQAALATAPRYSSEALCDAAKAQELAKIAAAISAGEMGYTQWQMTRDGYRQGKKTITYTCVETTK